MTATTTRTIRISEDNHELLMIMKIAMMKNTMENVSYDEVIGDLFQTLVTKDRTIKKLKEGK